MTSIQDNLRTIRKKIDTAAAGCGRNPKDITLVGVSKKMPVEKLCQAIDAGLTDLGENYIQEAVDKIDAIGRPAVCWHFIGHLQSNKAKYAVGLFDLIHTLDSVKLARELNKHAAGRGIVQKVLIQVNIGREATKSGVSTDDVAALAVAVSAMGNLSLRGLMTLPPMFNAPEQARPYFADLRKLARKIAADGIPNVRMDELSMGMTGDFEVAIEEGATLVRVGTALFGERQ